MFRTKTLVNSLSKTSSGVESTNSKTEDLESSYFHRMEESMMGIHSHDRNKDIKNEEDYSADIKPLKIKMNPLASVHNPIPLQTQAESFNKLREKLQKGVGLGNVGRSNLFKSIDIESFEKYLREPQYIKLFQKRTDVTRLRRLFLAQELRQHDSVVSGTRSRATTTSTNVEDTSRAIWSVKFSLDGKYMASGSKDGSINIWKVYSSPFERGDLNTVTDSTNINNKAKGKTVRKNNGSISSTVKDASEQSLVSNLYAPVFHPMPIMNFKEHLNDILDLDWSKNGFLISSSMDKTVKLWNIERTNSLRTFSHPDFVTCIRFSPLDDRFFLSGCLDHKCRLWSILDNNVSFEFDCNNLITAMAICPGSGKYTAIGTFNGYIHILKTKGLEYRYSFHVSDKQTQGLNPKVSITTSNSDLHHGPRISGLQCFFDSQDNSPRLVVTSNDSRIRIFDIENRKLLEYLKGLHSGSSQHKAYQTRFYGQDMVLSSSDDHWVYGWLLQSSKLDLKNEHTMELTGTSKTGTLKTLLKRTLSISSYQNKDKRGTIPATKESRSSFYHNFNLTKLIPISHPFFSQPLKNSSYSSFHAHHAPVTTCITAPLETAKILSLSNDVICELTLDYFNEMNSQANDKDMNSNDTANAENKSSKGSIFSHNSTLTSKGPGSLTVLNNSLPDMVKAVGTIIVTTDNSGIIRIFRSDMPYEIRKMVLKKLQTHKKEKDIHSNSSDSLNSISRIQLLPRLAIPKPVTIGAVSTAGANAYKYGSSLATASNQIQSTPRQQRPSRVFMSALFNHSSSSSISSDKLVRNSTSTTTLDQEFSNDNITYGNTAFRCNVCSGTQFDQTQYNPLKGNIDKNYYCVECGSQRNNFR